MSIKDEPLSLVRVSLVTHLVSTVLRSNSAVVLFIAFIGRPPLLAEPRGQRPFRWLSVPGFIHVPTGSFQTRS